MNKNSYKTIQDFRNARNKYKRNRDRREREHAHSLGLWYLPYEVQMILDHSIPDKELARKLGRTTSSIQNKRTALKRAMGRNY